ncbi:hypothetical protein GCM10010409_12220 [Mycolicibacterium diernhoferi]
MLPTLETLAGSGLYMIVGGVWSNLFMPARSSLTLERAAPGVDTIFAVCGAADAGGTDSR